MDLARGKTVPRASPGPSSSSQGNDPELSLVRGERFSYHDDRIGVHDPAERTGALTLHDRYRQTVFERWNGPDGRDIHGDRPVERITLGSGDFSNLEWRALTGHK